MCVCVNMCVCVCECEIVGVCVCLCGERESTLAVWIGAVPAERIGERRGIGISPKSLSSNSQSPSSRGSSGRHKSISKNPKTNIKKWKSEKKMFQRDTSWICRMERIKSVSIK